MPSAIRLPEPRAPTDLHTIKIKIPVRLKAQLDTLRLLRGQQMSESVTAALDLYFSKIDAAAR